MKDSFYRCDGSEYKVPLFDHVVATHFSNQATLTDHLIDQMGDDSVYAKIFKGKTNLTFLDIGANIGLISLYASPACKRIVALEPAPDTFRVLQAMTIGDINIEPYSIALAPKDEVSTLYLNDLNPTASSTVNTYGTQIHVNGYRLTSILNIYQLEHVDVCKVDAEGAEGESLSFDQLQACKDKIDAYYIEFHNCPSSTWEYKMSKVFGDLIRNGYYHQQIDGMTLYATK